MDVPAPRLAGGAGRRQFYFAAAAERKAPAGVRVLLAAIIRKTALRPACSGS
jgi:hypothetical protein